MLQCIAVYFFYSFLNEMNDFFFEMNKDFLYQRSSTIGAESQFKRVFVPSFPPSWYEHANLNFFLFGREAGARPAWFSVSV